MINYTYNFVLTQGKITVTMRDFNARVKNDRSEIESTMESFEEPLKNEWENPIIFCVRNDLKIMKAFFKHMEQYNFTRYR